MRANTKIIPYICAQCSYISPLGTGYIKFYQRNRKVKKLNIPYKYLTRLSWDFFPLSRKTVKRNPSDLYSGIHGRDLHYLTTEFSGHPVNHAVWLQHHEMSSLSVYL